MVAASLAVGAVVVAAVACLRFPLTSSPGPEAALVLSVVGGVALSLAQAVRAARASPDGYAAELGKALVIAGAMLAVFAVVTGVSGWLRPSCAPQRGFLAFLVLAAPVLVVHAAIGTLLGRALARPGRALVAAVALLCAAGLLLFVRWYRDPSFIITSHLFVVVAGDLLRGASMPTDVLGFRVATLCYGCAVAFGGAAAWPRIRRVGVAGGPTNTVVLWVLAGVAVVVGLVADSTSRSELRPPRAEMEARYSYVKQRGALVVHADPLALRPRDVDAVLAEGTLWLDRLATRLGTRPSGDIHVWLHADRGTAAHFTGAAHVDFALPWRREIHVEGADVPHRSLGHELAHVVAGELSTAPLRIPSRFVFFHHAAITEGVAVALTPELAANGGLTVKEQAAAMRRAGFAPDTAALFSGLSFFAESPARGYTAAGALIESLVARTLQNPTAALAALYGTGSLEEALGSPEAVEQLMAAHHAHLDELPLPEDAAAVAVARFERPSVLDDVCRPADAERVRAIRTRARTGDVAGALADVEALGPASQRTLEDLLADALRVDDEAAAVAFAERIAALPTPERKDAAALAAQRGEILGDALWRVGARARAFAEWDRARAEAMPVDEGRALLARRALAEVVLRGGATPASSAALGVLVATKPDERAAAFARLHLAIGADGANPPELRAEARDGVRVARYIHARRLVQQGALDEAVRALRLLLDDGKLPPPLLEQVQLALATALLKLDHAAEARDLLFAAADAAERPAARLLLRDRAERAARAVDAPEAPPHIDAKSDPAWADRLLLGADDAGF
ncbi:MAG: hypothetical protein HYS27_15485 [Deltaproteobacteria bacterium]|nr:hypothetical protein [Deltaproteobacteria bacterium]